MSEELNIVTIPSDLLFEKSRPVSNDEFGEELEQKLSDMATAMYQNRGTGLAGVQVGDLRRILVADLGYADNAEYKKELIKMVNPEILEASDDKITVTEGCLSYPGFSQKVTRPHQITVKYQSSDGEFHETTFSGFKAVVIQHEMDHFDGITLYGRASAFKQRRYKSKLESKFKKITKRFKDMAGRL